MTKSIKCSDVGVDCDWSASAESKEGLMIKIQAHAKEHGFEDIPPELATKIDSVIQES